MMKKITFVNVPLYHKILGDSTVAFDLGRFDNQIQDLISVATFVKNDSESMIIDGLADGLDFDDLVMNVIQSNCEIVLFLPTLTSIADTIKISQELKKRKNELKIILGGNYVNYFPMETLEVECIDFLLLGDPETSLLELLKSIGDSNRLKERNGYAYREDGKFVSRGSSQNITTEQLEMPPDGSFIHAKYTDALFENQPYFPIRLYRNSDLGINPVEFQGSERKLALEGIISVIKRYQEKGISHFAFSDSNFLADQEYAKKVCEKIKQEELKIFFDIFCSSPVDSNLLSTLKSAGCCRIQLWLSSKDLNGAKEAAHLIKSQGMDVVAHIEIGCKDQGRQEIMDLLPAIRSMGADFIQLRPTFLFPGTKVLKDAIEGDYVAADIWEAFARNPTDTFSAPVWSGSLHRDQIMLLSKKAYKHFYLRPSYILKRMLKLKGIGDLTHKLKKAAKLAKLETKS